MMWEIIYSLRRHFILLKGNLDGIPLCPLRQVTNLFVLNVFYKMGKIILVLPTAFHSCHEGVYRKKAYENSLESLKLYTSDW